MTPTLQLSEAGSGGAELLLSNNNDHINNNNAAAFSPCQESRFDSNQTDLAWLWLWLRSELAGEEDERPLSPLMVSISVIIMVTAMILNMIFIRIALKALDSALGWRGWPRSDRKSNSYKSAEQFLSSIEIVDTGKIAKVTKIHYNKSISQTTSADAFQWEDEASRHNSGDHN